MSDPKILDSTGRDAALSQSKPGSVAGYHVTTDFQLSTGLGSVKILVPGETVYRELSYLDAMRLGAALIKEGECCVMTAVIFRVLMEDDMPPDQAMAFYTMIVAAVREQHRASVLARESEAALKAQMETDDGTGTAH